ncbi:MAG: LytTR family DNA-binding domain-containing protein [Roseburia sp.]|nr:LytTR family DNA-binding domain-containing protein [Roseburia sp.]
MIKVAICDDSSREVEFSRKIVEEIMEDYSVPCEIVEFASGEMLLQTNLDFHLVFLDIVMDEKNGISVGNEIYRRNRRTKVIFQTSFKEYCKDAINVSHAFAFLEKPLMKEEVKVQIEAFLENGMDLMNPCMEFQNVICTYGGAEESKAVVSLPIRDIMYFSYLKTMKKVKIVTEDSEYIYKTAMNAIVKRMKPFQFAVSCRGMLVNLENVEKIQGYQVLLKNGDKVALSQKRVQEFRTKLGNCIQNSVRRR